MLLRLGKILPLLCLAGTACTSFEQEAEPKAAVVVSRNPAMLQLIEAETREETLYPSLASVPTTGPERETRAELERINAALIASQQDLIAKTGQDRLDAAALRAEGVQISERGRPVRVEVDEAVARLEQAKNADQAAAAKQARTPVPQLGGQPPKDKR